MLIFRSESAPCYDSHSQLYVYRKIVKTQYLRIWIPKCRQVGDKIRACMHWFWDTNITNISVWTLIAGKYSSYPNAVWWIVWLYLMIGILCQWNHDLRRSKDIHGFDGSTPLSMSPHHAPTAWYKWSIILYVYIQAMKYIFFADQYPLTNNRIVTFLLLISFAFV